MIIDGIHPHHGRLQPPAARITLNNPPLNVIDMPMMDELRAALEQIEARPEISAIVFAGSERAFSSGVDIAAHTPDKVRDMLTAFHSVIRSVVDNSKLTIASVRRHCLGGGAELALMCDIVYASPDSVWGFPEIKLACYPPVASVALSAIVGQKLAAEMVLTGRTLTGEEALAAGLVNGLADDPETLVAECLQRVSQLSPAALAVGEEGVLCVGCDSLRQRTGARRADLFRRADENRRCAGRHRGVHGAPPAEVGGESEFMDYEITPEELKSLRDAGHDVMVLDVREPWEYQTSRKSQAASTFRWARSLRASIRSSIPRTTLWWFATTACAP